MQLQGKDGSRAIGLGAGGQVSRAPNFMEQIRKSPDPNLGMKLASNPMVRKLAGKKVSQLATLAMSASPQGAKGLRELSKMKPAQVRQMLAEAGNDPMKVVTEAAKGADKSASAKPSPSPSPSPSPKKGKRKDPSPGF